MRLPRPLWIGVATVALVVMSVGLLIGIPTYQQQTAIVEIARLGGQFETRPRGPEWLRRLAGEDRMKRFDDVVEVRLRDTQADNGTLALLGRLTALQRLWIANTRVTDAGLVHLKGLHRLQELSLAETQVTDAGLLQLKDLENLRWLYLGRTRVSSTGASELERGVPGLRIFR
jgi:hypothetical protein